jgi:hypothetical protein
MLVKVGMRDVPKSSLLSSNASFAHCLISMEFLSKGDWLAGSGGSSGAL